MRRVAWWLLLLFAFAIPWEYYMDLGEPLGNIARIVGVLLLLVAIPAVLQAGRLRTPGPLQWLVLAFYLWFCCSYFWTIEPVETLEKIRAYFQELMVVWLVWEFAESAGDLRALLRAYVAGSWVLALLTVANIVSPEAVASGQIRFAAGGQDPNDVARFLDLGFPMAALLFDGESGWAGRLLSGGYLSLGLIAVLLTASRGGFLAHGGIGRLRNTAGPKSSSRGVCRDLCFARDSRCTVVYRFARNPGTPVYHFRAAKGRRFEPAAEHLGRGPARFCARTVLWQRGGFLCLRRRFGALRYRS